MTPVDAVTAKHQYTVCVSIKPPEDACSLLGVCTLAYVHYIIVQITDNVVL